METDKRYFVAGLFIILISVGVILAFLWLAGSERRDDIQYQVRFKESVSGLALGESVKYRGVDVGNVKVIALDPADPRMVLVTLSIRKSAPIKTDTRATLKIKGVTGAMFIEFNGGNPKTQMLLAVTPTGDMPEIASERSSLTAAIDQLPKVVEKFSAIEDQAKSVLNDVGTLASKVKENPSLLLRRPKEKDKESIGAEVRK